MASRFKLAHHPDPHPELAVERGRAGEGVGIWVPNEKHTYLAKYVEATYAARKQYGRRVLVDLFCGPGRIQVKGETITRHGGALISWLHSRVHESADFTDIFIGDLDAERAHACAKRLEAFGAPVTAFPGAAEVVVEEVMQVIPKRSLTLVYLDPYNLQYLSFEIIRRLAEIPRVDFAIHFSTMDLRRNVLMEFNPERARFDQAAPGWRDHIDPVTFVRGDADAAFFDYWCSLVEGLGFKISNRMPLVRDDANRPLYHLVFFSRHELPNRIWSEVAQGANRELNF